MSWNSTTHTTSPDKLQLATKETSNTSTCCSAACIRHSRPHSGQTLEGNAACRQFTCSESSLFRRCRRFISASLRSSSLRCCVINCSSAPFFFVCHTEGRSQWHELKRAFCMKRHAAPRLSKLMSTAVRSLGCMSKPARARRVQT